MNKAKWLLLFLVAIFMAIPSYAVELSLGGFPSYMRTRARFIKDATFISSISDDQARLLGFNDADDNIMFVDTRLRLTPQLVLSDAVTIRAQVDVFDNVIWGGATSALLGGRSTLVNSSLTTGDRFRGALLVGANAIDRGIGESFGVDDNVQFFNVRMLHADIVLPANLGFVRIGRQPFDWGLGILANGGWDPLSDLGFVLDRFLYLKSWPLGGGTFTFVFVSDKFTQGNTLVNGNGDGWDGGAAAIIYNHPNVFGGNLTVGAYDFPYIHQTNFLGTDLNVDWFNLYAGLIDWKSDMLRLVGEIQGGVGKISGTGGADLDITGHNLLWAVRAEYYPGFPVKNISAEFGWAGGDDGNDPDFTGNVIVFNPAYNLDNLLFKHMIPTIYQIEGSVINAFYARAWGTVKLLDNLSFTPQVVVAWNQETSAPLGPGTQNVDRYMGTEVEGTFTVNVVPGVNLDLIGSLVISGSGLKDLLEQQAATNVNAAVEGGNFTPNDFNAEDVAWGVQARLLIYIDQFFK